MNRSPLAQNIKNDLNSNPLDLKAGIEFQVASRRFLFGKTGVLMCAVITGALLQNEGSSRAIQLVFEGFINSFFISSIFAMAIVMCGFVLIFIEKEMPFLMLKAPIELVQSFCLLPKYLCFGILICLPIFDSGLIQGVTKYYVQLFFIALLLEMPNVLINIKSSIEGADFKQLNATKVYNISKSTIWALIVYDIIGGFLFSAPTVKLVSLGNILTDVHLAGFEKVVSVLSCAIIIAALERHFRPK